jgi:hypothetical protein
MATKRTKPPVQPLSFMELLELVTGPHGRPDVPNEFPTDAARREAWNQHRDEVLQRAHYDPSDGREPPWALEQFG